MPAPATRRINRGSGHSYYLDGVEVGGVTRIVREGVPSPQFIDAAARNVAGYAIDHWDELAQKTPSKRLAELVASRWAERDAAAVRGKTVHRYAQDLAAGLEVEVPDALIGYVDSYLAFAEAYRLVELEVEATVVSRRWHYMGTVDLLATVDDAPAVWLLDWKTGASGIWPEVALQLAAYAHAEAIVDADGTERPMPPIERAAAVWLRGDGYDVVPVDISEATFRVFLYAQQMAAYRAAPREQYVGEALPPRRLEVAS